MKPTPDTPTQTPIESLDATINAVATSPESEPVRPILDQVWNRFAETTEPLQNGVDTLELTAMEAFGPTSRLVVQVREAVPFRELLTDHPIYQGILLLLAVAYALMVCAHLHEILGSFTRMRSGEGRLGTNSQAIHTSAIIGVLLLSALVVRLCEGTLGQFYGTMTLLLFALAACIGVTLFQCGMILLIGRVVLMRDLADGVVSLKILHFGVGTLILAPLILLQLLCPPGEGSAWFYLLLGMAGIVIFLFIKETFNLFLAKKVSIFHWFLYLCAVECFPISLIWLSALRW